MKDDPTTSADLKKESLKCIVVADHMLTQTYPLLKDPKILVAVMDNLFLGISYAIRALLEFEKKYKRIPAFGETFDSKFHIFKEYCLKRYNIPKGYIGFISEIKEIALENRKSNVSFSRKDKYVICSEDYKMRTLSIKEMREKIQKAKLFIDRICSILENNERVVLKRQRRVKAD